MASTEKSVDLINNYFCGIGKTLDDKLPRGLDIGTMIQTDCLFDIRPEISGEVVSELIDEIDINL